MKFFFFSCGRRRRKSAVEVNISGFRKGARGIKLDVHVSWSGWLVGDPPLRVALWLAERRLYSILQFLCPIFYNLFIFFDRTKVLCHHANFLLLVPQLVCVLLVDVRTACVQVIISGSGVITGQIFNGSSIFEIRILTYVGFELTASWGQSQTFWVFSFFFGQKFRISINNENPLSYMTCLFLLDRIKGIIYLKAFFFFGLHLYWRTQRKDNLTKWLNHCSIILLTVPYKKFICKMSSYS